MESEERTLLKTFSNVEAAELASAQLQANGIDCSIEANDAGGMLPFLQVPEGVKLFVPKSQFDEAKELLDSVQPET
jgi:putative signal transducing protein